MKVNQMPEHAQQHTFSNIHAHTLAHTAQWNFNAKNKYIYLFHVRAGGASR